MYTCKECGGIMFLRGEQRKGMSQMVRYWKCSGCKLVSKETVEVVYKDSYDGY